MKEEEKLRKTLHNWLDDYFQSYKQDPALVENHFNKSLEHMGIPSNLDTVFSFLFGIAFGSLQTQTESSSLSENIKDKIFLEVFLELQNRIIDLREYYEKTHWK